MKKQRKNKIIFSIIFVFFCLILFFRPTLAVFENRNGFFSPGYSERFETLKKEYFSSQYVKKENPNIMPDNAFESYVAGAFIRGENPIHIVHEHPPLGRYLLGLSILIFDNPDTITPPLIIITLIGIYLISNIILKNKWLALIPVGIFANEPLFLSKFRYSPQIETVQMTFIVLALYFFIKGIIGKNFTRYFILSSIMLGFVISIRFFILGAALVFSMALFFFIKKQFNRKFINFILSLPLALVVLIASYTKTIQEGYSIFQVFSIQKYIFYYHKSKLMIFFTFWDLIMFNKWHTWWGDRRILTDSEWFIVWPISMILNLLHIFLGLLKKIKFSDPEIIISLWIVCYCGLLSVGFSTTRYFLPLSPFLYIMAVSFLIKIIRVFAKSRK